MFSFIVFQKQHQTAVAPVKQGGKRNKMKPFTVFEISAFDSIATSGLRLFRSEAFSTGCWSTGASP